MQLNLFEHAPRHYYASLQSLAQLDFGGCRRALARHRVGSPAGPDAAPVEQAAEWLEARVPEASDPPEVFGSKALILCRELRGEHACVPELLRGSRQLARTVVAVLAGQANQRRLETEIGAEVALGPELPWGVFLLLSGRFAEARRALLDFLAADGPTPAACLALGEACVGIGRGDEAVCAWREGYGLAPTGDPWLPVPPWIAELCDEYADDPVFEGGWWVVGAYLEGRFPRYVLAPPGLVVRRWRRFLREEIQDKSPARFLAGLFLSEHGAALPAKDLALVRRTLAELHPEAYALHREQLEEEGPPRAFRGKTYLAW